MDSVRGTRYEASRIPKIGEKSSARAVEGGSRLLEPFVSRLLLRELFQVFPDGLTEVKGFALTAVDYELIPGVFHLPGDAGPEDEVLFLFTCLQSGLSV